MKSFLDSDFLLTNKTAQWLFHDYADALPIIDYHTHLSATQIMENNRFTNLGELWLKDDHYKWRLMRANGVSEEYITGSATFYDKYLAFAETLEWSIGNPVYHWTHLELQRYFNIDTPLNSSTANEIWDEVQRKLAKMVLRPQDVLKKFNVEALFTTEDPIDNLDSHNILNTDGIRVFPAFRPDAILALAGVGYRDYIQKLSQASHIEIKSLDDLKEAVSNMINIFDGNGCRASDHDLQELVFMPASEQSLKELFLRVLQGERATLTEEALFRAHMLVFLAGEYKKRDWAMELHIGCYRDQNVSMVRQVGQASGFDGIRDQPIIKDLTLLLNEIQTQHGSLGKMILFTLNERDNWPLVALCNSFQDDYFPSKIQFGTAWWMQDNIWGMEQQLASFANNGLLGRFLGMLTDSRSFLSFPRHEYFRRIACNMIGIYVEEGQFPNDKALLINLIQAISYNNAKQFFGI